MNDFDNVHKGTKTMWKTYLKISAVRSVIFRPVVLLLARLDISPDLVSYIGVISMALFVGFIKFNPGLAFVFFVIGAAIDWVDGPLARYIKKSSDQGKFVDMTCDSLVFSLFVAGLVFAGVLDGFIGLLLVYFQVMSKIMRVIFNGLDFESNWHFKAVAGFVPNFIVALLFVAFAVFHFYPFPYFDYLATVFAAWLVLDMALFYVRILKR